MKEWNTIMKLQVVGEVWKFIGQKEKFLPLNPIS
jgi:hypothetical protein